MNSLFLCCLFIGAICHIVSAVKSPAKTRCGFCLDSEVNNLVLQMDYEGILLRKEKAPACGNDERYTIECESGCFELSVTHDNGTIVGRMQDCSSVVFIPPSQNGFPTGLNEIQKENGRSGKLLYTFDFQTGKSCHFCANGARSWEDKNKVHNDEGSERSSNKQVYYGITIGVLGMFFSYLVIFVTARMYCSRKKVGAGIPRIMETTAV